MTATNASEYQRLITNPQADIFRSKKDVENFFKKKHKSIYQNKSTWKKIDESICTGSELNMEFITCIYYGDLYKKMSAQDFEEFLNRLGMSWDLFSAVKDMVCVDTGKDYPKRVCKYSRYSLCSIACKP